MSAASVLRHLSFDSHAYDLGIFTNALWNIAHGHGFFSSVKDGISLLSDHQSPLLALFAPIFRIFPDPVVLLVFQGVGLAAGAFPLYRLARQYEAGEWSAALPLFYWAWLPLRNANAFDFHPEVFMLPLFLAAIAGLQSPRGRSRVLGAIAFMLALGAKESAGPVAFGIGLSWLLGAGPSQTRDWTRKLGAVAAMLGLAVFVFDIKVVPAQVLSASRYAYEGLYEQYGGGLTGILLAPVRMPALFFSQLFGHERLKFLFWTLAPLGFLPLLNWRALPAALPGYLMLFLSAGSHRVNLQYHYAIEPGVGLFWALPGACAVLRRWQPRAPRRKIWATALVIFIAACTFGRGEMTRIRREWPDAYDRWRVSKFIPCVDPDLSLAVTDAELPHLATRAWVHLPNSRVDGSGKPVSCVVLDREHFDVSAYQRVYACGGLEVYAWGGAHCMRCDPGCGPDALSR
ncbi:MAG: DUF2079 domain-containing protein [Oligoflexia bacterium]|nr:DUF2079 domain-containing protein [Oligoflexia bacterium]